jgi:hypothetical protein
MTTAEPQTEKPAAAPEELKALREEFLAIERSAERYVTIYLSALAVGATWLIGPERMNPQEIVSGHDGKNIFVLITLCLVNLSLVCLVLFKGLQIHELMQFAVTRAPTDSIIPAWEEWRREKFSLTGRIRVLHYIVTSGFPLTMGLALLGFIAIASFAQPEWLVKNDDVTTRTVSSLAVRVYWGVIVALYFLILPSYLYLGAPGARRRWMAIQANPAERDPKRLFQLMHLGPRTVTHASQEAGEVKDGQAAGSTQPPASPPT